MLQPVIVRLGLRYISRRLFQSLLFILGVALGVAVVIAIDLANNSASRAFALSASSITGNATHQITGGPAGLPTALYRDIRLELDIEASAPIVSESLRVRDFENQPMRLLGVDPFAEPPFRSYLETVTVLGESDIDPFDALVNFIAEPDTVLISTTVAGRYDVEPGATITLRIGATARDVRVIGVLMPDDRVSRQALDDLILTDISTAQELAGLTGRISRIDLILPDTYDTSQITDMLPDGAALQAVGGSTNTLDQMTRAFEINLQALSLLAVVVGIFLIYNTVSFSVVQRRPMIGIMRSLGATKSQIFTFIIGEAFVLGLIGTVLGMGLGIIFGRFMVGLVAQTISDLYFAVNVSTLTVDPITLLKGVGLGLVASVGAAVIPSIDATRTAPTGTMKRSQYEEQVRALLPYITIAAILLMGAGLLLLQVPTDSLIVSFAALFCVILSGALFTPGFMLVMMHLFTPLVDRLFGVVGRMAPRAVTRALSRTSVAVAALTISVSVIVGVSVMIGSFRSTVGNWLDNTLGADIYVSPPLLTANIATTDVDPQVRELMVSTAGVATVSASRSVTVQAPDYPDLPPVNLVAVDSDISTDRRYVWNRAEGGDMQAALQAGKVMVSEPFAFRRGITPDDNTIRLRSDAGIQTFEVVAVYYDYSTDQGSVYMHRTTYDQYWDDPFVSSLAAYVEPDASIAAVIQRMRTDTLQDYDLTVQDQRSLRQGVFEVFERTFTITIALRLLATLVAFIGILSALMALQLEHTREYGTMRANGMTPRQLWNFTLIQTGLMGTVAGLLALPIGVILALVLIYVINLRSFGWTLQFTFLPDEFAAAFAVAVMAALLAGLYPAWRLTRMQPSQALRSE